MGQFESGVAAKLLGVVRSVVLEEPWPFLLHFL